MISQVGRLEAVAAVDEQEHAPERRATAQIGGDQRGPGLDLFLRRLGKAVARHVDEIERLSSGVKKLSSCVRPGVLEVRARPPLRTSALMRLDLPTLERPAKAISKPSAAEASSATTPFTKLPRPREQLLAGRKQSSSENSVVGHGSRLRAIKSKAALAEHS